MKMFTRIPLLITVVILLSLRSLTGQEEITDNAAKMHWFKDAKLGIFIHWGVYSVNGIDESWSFYNEYIPYDDYMSQLSGFTAKNYKPKEWVELIKKSGARYAVITTKHHDGVALWDSELSRLNVVDTTPAGKDLIAPLVKQLEKEKIKVGLYFSLLDWSHTDYPNFTKSKKRYDTDSLRWSRFVEFNMAQINELMVNYNPDLIWFDGDWEQTAEKWKATEIRETILEHNNNIIINSRLQGYGDYATPEQGLPVLRPDDSYWELCMTINDSWGYQPNDTNYKSIDLIIQIFADCISMGGNLLLDIGPREDGTIPDEQIEVLEELGSWINKHDKAIYGTHAGLPPGYFNGPSTLSADSTTLYLFLPYEPISNVTLKGVKNNINRIWVVGNGTKLNYSTYLKPYWSSKSGLISIDVPEDVTDDRMTVIAVLLDGRIELEK